MKKITTVVVVCIISTQLFGQTRTKKHAPPPPPEPPVEVAVPVPPPPPPLPPAPPEMQVISDVKIESVSKVPAPPPPPPPAPPTPPYRKVNERGYSMDIKTINDKTTIKVKKGGFSEMIPLEKWNANKAYYEKRYGKLPAAPVIVEDVNFTPPVIEPDKES